MPSPRNAARIEGAHAAPVLRAAGDSALLVEFGDRLDPAINNAAIAFDARLREAAIGGVSETTPTIRSVLVRYDPLDIAPASLRARLNGEQKDRIEEVLNTIRLEASRNRPAGLLSHGQKQFLEIGMLLMQEPHLLLLDEPVAGRTDAETEFTAELFKSLARKHSLMVVEHDMGFVGSIADHVTVLHQGSVLAEGSLEQVQADERVIEVYLGR